MHAYDQGGLADKETKPTTDVGGLLDQLRLAGRSIEAVYCAERMVFVLSELGPGQTLKHPGHTCFRVGRVIEGEIVHVLNGNETVTGQGDIYRICSSDPYQERCSGMNHTRTADIFFPVLQYRDSAE